MDRQALLRQAVSRDTTLRLGLVGAGPWGRNYIRTVRNLPGVVLHRLASRNPQSAQWVDGSACRISEDWRPLLDAGDLDGLIIASPPDTHVPIAMAAVHCGLPVLVEKPLSMHAEESAQLLAAASSRPAIVMVDHIHLYSPAWAAMKRAMQGMGRLRRIRAVAGKWGPFRTDTPVLWDWGPHDLAMLLDVLGPPDRAGCRRLERAEGQPSGEMLQLHFVFADEVTADITIGNIMQQKTRLFEMHFDGQALVYDDTQASKLSAFRLSDGGVVPGSARNIPHASTPALDNVVRVFADRIRHGRSDIGDLAMAHRITTILQSMHCE